MRRTFFRNAAIGSIFFILMAGILYSRFFGPVASIASGPTDFVVAPHTTVGQLAGQLRDQGYVQSTWALRVALLKEAHGRSIGAGGYKISNDMDAWTIASIFANPPALAFVTFPSSIRKEQMGEILADALHWSDRTKAEWDTVATSPDPAFTEGVYAPGTYLIPSDQTPAQIAARLRGRFTDEFAPYAQEAQEKGMAWTDVLTLASIVDREAAKNDRDIVAGILLNRLAIGMKLQADATLQYAKGTEDNWWPTPHSADKYLASAFNTYQHAGLPPHPIDNPTMESVEAVLNPADTDCLFYLHDSDHRIHCSVTYGGQKQNVETFLR